MPDGIDFQTLIVLVIVVIGGLQKVLSAFTKKKSSPTPREFTPYEPPSYEPEPYEYEDSQPTPQRRTATLPQPQTMADLTELLRNQYQRTVEDTPPPLPAKLAPQKIEKPKKVTPKILTHRVETKLNQSARDQALNLLKKKSSLKQAVILQEVLGKPKSLN